MTNKLKIKNHPVSESLLAYFRRFFAYIPESMTAGEALAYARWCKALDGDKQAQADVKKETVKEEKVVGKKTVDSFIESLNAPK